MSNKDSTPSFPSFRGGLHPGGIEKVDPSKLPKRPLPETVAKKTEDTNTSPDSTPKLPGKILDFRRFVHEKQPGQGQGEYKPSQRLLEFIESLSPPDRIKLARLVSLEQLHPNRAKKIRERFPLLKRYRAYEQTPSSPKNKDEPLKEE